MIYKIKWNNIGQVDSLLNLKLLPKRAFWIWLSFLEAEMKKINNKPKISSQMRPFLTQSI